MAAPPSLFELWHARVCAWSWRRIINGACVRGEQFPSITVQPITVLLNPRAGSRDTASADDIAAAFRSAQCDADIRIIDGPSIAAAATDALKRGSRVLAAAGGDGTVSAVASVVAETGATLGVIPLGTLNHFAKDLKIFMDGVGLKKVHIVGTKLGGRIALHFAKAYPDRLHSMTLVCTPMTISPSSR